MNEEKKIEIIKDLLYERTTREMLLQSSEQPAGTSTVRRLYRVIAAVAAILVLAFAVYQLTGPTVGDEQHRLALAEKAYQVPPMNATRGASTATIDQYIADYNAKNYNKILPALKANHEAEKDAYALATIYYDQGKLDQSLAIISNTTWTDDYYAEQLEWLEFVILFRQGADLDALHSQAAELSIGNAEKAGELMKNE